MDLRYVAGDRLIGLLAGKADHQHPPLSVDRRAALGRTRRRRPGRSRTGRFRPRFRCRCSRVPGTAARGADVALQGKDSANS